jgi:hypothetical protein
MNQTLEFLTHLLQLGIGGVGLATALTVAHRKRNEQRRDSNDRGDEGPDA